MTTIMTNRIRIGVLGPAGSNSELAARQIYSTIDFLEREPEIIYFATPKALHKALEHRKSSTFWIDFAVIPIENSITGEITSFTKEFSNDGSYDVYKEYTLPIHHCLYKLPWIPTEYLTCVYSHPQALMQTAHTRRQKYSLPENVIESTSLAARQLAEGILPTHAAVICTKEAGEKNHLKLVAENIEDSQNNRTKFILIGV